MFGQYTVIQDHDPIKEGDEVEFEIVEGPKGPMATRIMKLS